MNIEEHDCGDENCEMCFHKPKKCMCGGLIHNEFGDENSDCDYWCYEKCDKCGDDFCEDDNK